MQLYRYRQGHCFLFWMFGSLMTSHISHCRHYLFCKRYKYIIRAMTTSKLDSNVRRRALILLLATIGVIVAVRVVAVSNGNGGGMPSVLSFRVWPLGHATTESGNYTPALTPDVTGITSKCFDTTIELRKVVDFYFADDRSNSSVASTYGWPIGDWCVSNIEDFSELFSPSRNPAAVDFNEDISRWDVSNAKTMESMFAGSFDGSTRFNQPLADWNVSSVTDMRKMFCFADSFDQPLEDWDVSSVTDMSRMFENAYHFNQPLAAWNVSSVTHMFRMFYAASSFDQPLVDWNLSSVTNTNFMFDSFFT
jgi:surface protein